MQSLASVEDSYFSVARPGLANWEVKSKRACSLGGMETKNAGDISLPPRSPYFLPPLKERLRGVMQ